MELLSKEALWDGLLRRFDSPTAISNVAHIGCRQKFTETGLVAFRTRKTCLEPAVGYSQRLVSQAGFQDGLLCKTPLSPSCGACTRG